MYANQTVHNNKIHSSISYAQKNQVPSSNSKLEEKYIC